MGTGMKHIQDTIFLLFKEILIVSSWGFNE
jgi:hypothetical protein